MPTITVPARARYFLAAALFSLVLAPSSIASPAGDHADPSVPSPVAIRIDNFARVDAQLYRGAQPQGSDFADLKALGIKTIVNLTSDDADPNEQALVEAAGIAYVAIPMTTRAAPTGAQVAQFLKVVNDSAEQPVFVHCVGGRHRTGVMTAIYRMTHDGWSSDRAFQEMKQYKFGADFLHPELKDFVYHYRPEGLGEATTAAANTGAQQ